jgi:hypothetical protein
MYFIIIVSSSFIRLKIRFRSKEQTMLPDPYTAFLQLPSQNSANLKKSRPFLNKFLKMLVLLLKIYRSILKSPIIQNYWKKLIMINIFAGFNDKDAENSIL